MTAALLERLLVTPAEALATTLTEADWAEIGARWSDWANQVWTASRSGDHGRALAIQTLLIHLLALAAPESAPALALAWANLGHVQAAAGQIADARASWTRAHALCAGPPPNPAARADIALNLGRSYWLEGDYAAALPWLEQATADYALLPDSMSAGFAFGWLGDVLAGLGRLDEAIPAYRRSHDIFVGLGQPARAAERLAGLAEAELAAGHLETGLAALMDAVAEAEASSDDACLFRLLEQLAHAQVVAAQDYPAALAAAQRACALAEGAADPELRREAATAHWLAGQICQALARWDEATGHYEQAAAGAPADDPQAQALCQETLAGAYAHVGRYEAAQAAYERALAFYTGRADLAPSAVRVLGELGQLAWQWGRPDQALKHYTAALRQAEAANLSGWAGDMARAIGNLYAYALGLPEEARAYYRRAAAAYAAVSDREGRIEAACQAGDLAMAAGDAAAAIASYAVARRQARGAGDRLTMARCASALANAYAALGNEQAALRHAHAARRIYRDLNLPAQLGQSELDLGGLLARFGRAERAARAYRRAVRIYEASGDAAGAGMALVAAALADFERARYAAAGRALRRALALTKIESLENFSTVHTAHLGLGAIAERTGHPGVALRHYRAALALAERYRAAMLHPQFRLAFGSTRQNLYARAVVLAARQQQATAAWEHMEASRSRTFVDLLALTPLPQPADRVPPAALAEESRWLGRLRGLLTQKPGHDPDYWQQLQEAWEHLEQLWASLADTEYAAMRQGRPATFAAIRHCLEAASPASA